MSSPLSAVSNSRCESTHSPFCTLLTQRCVVVPCHGWTFTSTLYARILVLTHGCCRSRFVERRTSRRVYNSALWSVVLQELVCSHQHNPRWSNRKLTACPIGRTTFVNTLCGKKVLQGKDADDATNAHLEEGVRIKPITVGAFLILSISRLEKFP